MSVMSKETAKNVLRELEAISEGIFNISIFQSSITSSWKSYYAIEYFKDFHQSANRASSKIISFFIRVNFSRFLHFLAIELHLKFYYYYYYYYYYYPWCEVYGNNSFLNCGCRWKWRIIIAVSFFSNLSNWKEEAWKKSGLQRDSKPVTSTLPVRCSSNWAMKPQIY